MSNLFIVACREKTLIYLEPNYDDLVQTVVDTIAQLVKQNPDDLAIWFKGQRLQGKKTLRECDISLEGELPVEPIKIFFVFKKPDTDDEWEEPFMDEMSKPPPTAGDALREGTASDGAAAAEGGATVPPPAS
mmetsp:Transcript_11675/g.29979  ORF Transcript_11675/g.29979 Transcript_11675/m.29979 type:complete len:132 (+) Transcript_11675:101-496(+)